MFYSCLGCFSTIKYYDRSDIRTLLEKEEELSFTTMRLDRYSLHLPNTYKFKNDTVFGLVKSEQWNIRSYQAIKIPFRDIHKIEKKEFDAGNTTLLGVTIVGVVLAIKSCLGSMSFGFSSR